MQHYWAPVQGAFYKKLIAYKSSSPPQTYLGRVRRYPHLGECTLPQRVLAVACTMRNEALRKRYAALMERYGTVNENIDFAHH